MANKQYNTDQAALPESHESINPLAQKAMLPDDFFESELFRLEGILRALKNRKRLSVYKVSG